MSRWLDREEEKPGEDSGMLDGLSRSGGEKRTRTPEEDEAPKDFGGNGWERVVVRSREYRVRPSQIEGLRTIGSFRVVDSVDLVRGTYGGRTELARADVRSLERQGLLRSVSFLARDGKPRKIHTLTRQGHTLAKDRTDSGQELHWGFLKPAEVEHDSLLYRAFLRESQRIHGNGGTVKRVALDTELKSKYFSRVYRKDGPESYRARQAATARELHLPIVDGHVVFPDVRLEYEDERGELSRVDIEVATGNYRPEQVATKAAAGFHVYAAGGAGGRFSVDQGHGLSGNIFREQRMVVYPL
jgi:hypothetical protein